MSACDCVYPLAYLKNHNVQISSNSLYVTMAVARSSSMTTLRYVMYFRYCGWRHVFTSTTMRFIQFARRRHRGEVVVYDYWLVCCKYFKNKKYINSLLLDSLPAKRVRHLVFLHCQCPVHSIYVVQFYVDQSFTTHYWSVVEEANESCRVDDLGAWLNV